MKRFRILFPFLAILFIHPVNSSAQEKEIHINSKISEVTVFLNGAQILREGTLSIPGGMANVVFENLPGTISPSSLQVVTDNSAVTIHSVVHRVNYLKDMPKTPYIIALEDSAEMLRYRLEELANKRYVMENEQNLLLANKAIGGQNTGVQVAELEDAADFFRSRLTEIRRELLHVKTEETRIHKHLSGIDQRLKEFNTRKNEAVHEVLVTLSSQASTLVKLQLSYLVSGASWSPFYDIRAKNVQSPVLLFYKARINQRTGEEWKNVSLKLSTGNPTVSGNKPRLHTMFMNNIFTDPVEMNAAQGYTQDLKTNSISRSKDEEVQQPSSISQTMLNIEFKITQPYSIPNDGTPHQVDIQQFTLPATYQYYAVPKLEKDAFLLAKITAGEEVKQLTGPANVYFENTFVGETRVNASVSDTVEISLGRDKRILLERQKIKDFTSKKGGGTRKEYTIRITVRNNLKVPVDIHLDDQIPVSTQKNLRGEA